MSARPVPDAPPPRAVIKRFLLLGPLVGWAVVALGFVFLTTALTGSRFGSPVEGLVSGLLLVTVFGLPLAYLQGGIPAILTGVVVSRWDGQMPRRRYVARAAGVGALIAAAVSSAPALLYAASRLLQGRHADLMNIPPAAAGAAALGGLAAAVCAWSLRRRPPPDYAPRPPPTASAERAFSEPTDRPWHGYVLTLAIVAPFAGWSAPSDALGSRATRTGPSVCEAAHARIARDLSPEQFARLGLKPCRTTPYPHRLVLNPVALDRHATR